MKERTAAPFRAFRTRCCPAPGRRALAPADARAAAERLTLLADPVRLTLLGVIGGAPDEVCACDLESAVDVKQPTVSHHLRLLRESGLVHARKHGQWSYYRVDGEALAGLRAELEGVFDALGAKAPARRRARR